MILEKILSLSYPKNSRNSEKRSKKFHTNKKKLERKEKREQRKGEHGFVGDTHKKTLWN